MQSSRRPYQDGKLLQMDSVECGRDTKDAKKKKGKTRGLLCQEYVIEADQVLFRIRPRAPSECEPKLAMISS
jgi:hypothetical protein